MNKCLGIAVFSAFLLVSVYAELGPDAVDSGLSISFTGGLVFNDDGISTAESGVPGAHTGELEVAFDAGVAGFSGIIEFENDAVAVPFQNYEGWVKLYDVVTVHAGKILYDEFVLTDYFEDDDFNTPLADSEYGIAFSFNSIEGFSGSVFIPAPFTAGTSETGEEAVMTPWEDFFPAVGFSQRLGEIGTAYVSYRMQNKELAILTEIDCVNATVILAGYTGFYDEEEAPLHRINLSAGRVFNDLLDTGVAFRIDLQDGETRGYGKIAVAFPMEMLTPSVYVSGLGTSSDGWDETGFGGALEYSPQDGVAFSIGIDCVYIDSLEWGVPILVEVEL